MKKYLTLSHLIFVVIIGIIIFFFLFYLVSWISQEQFGDSGTKATTENHKVITIFMLGKFTQCATGETNLTYASNASEGTTTVSCSSNAAGHVDAIINHLKFKNILNPYITPEQAAYKSDNNNPNVGSTHINCSGNTCNIYTNTGSEILSDTVTKE